jgi:hypothetical protein
MVGYEMLSYIFVFFILLCTYPSYVLSVRVMWK